LFRQKLNTHIKEKLTPALTGTTNEWILKNEHISEHYNIKLNSSNSYYYTKTMYNRIQNLCLENVEKILSGVEIQFPENVVYDRGY
jgi:glucan-binding YG repeat protein